MLTVRQHWLPLACMPVGIVISVVPLAFSLSSTLRGVVLGAAAASGIWLDGLIVMLWSGAASQMMGASAEGNTASVLQEFARQGLRLINGVKLAGRGDIDHIAVGPSGVLVFETKWSAQKWRLEDDNPSYMTSQVKNAAIQVQKSAAEVRELVSTIAPHVPVTAAVVFWSGGHAFQSGTARSKPFRCEPAVLIHGPTLSKWVSGELRNINVDQVTLDRVWSHLVDVVGAADELDEYAGDGAPLTFSQLASEWLLKPLVGVIAAMYAFSAGGRLVTWPVLFVVSAFGVALGLPVLRLRALRRAAIGWSATLAILLVLLAAVELASVVH